MYMGRFCLLYFRVHKKSHKSNCLLDSLCKKTHWHTDTHNTMKVITAVLNLQKLVSVIFPFITKWQPLKKSLLNYVGCVGSWVAWVRGCVGGVGQSLAWVAWVAWVHKILTWMSWMAWIKILAWVACVNKILAWVVWVTWVKKWSSAKKWHGFKSLAI